MSLRKLEKPKVQEVINRGGQVPEESSSKKKTRTFGLRIPCEWIPKIKKEIDGQLGMSVTLWILLAIQSRFKKE